MCGCRDTELQVEMVIFLENCFFLSIWKLHKKRTALLSIFMILFTFTVKYKKLEK